MFDFLTQLVLTVFGGWLVELIKKRPGPPKPMPA